MKQKAAINSNRIGVIPTLFAVLSFFLLSYVLYTIHTILTAYYIASKQSYFIDHVNNYLTSTSELNLPTILPNHTKTSLVELSSIMKIMRSLYAEDYSRFQQILDSHMHNLKIEKNDLDEIDSYITKAAELGKISSSSYSSDSSKIDLQDFSLITKQEELQNTKNKTLAILKDILVKRIDADINISSYYKYKLTKDTLELLDIRLPDLRVSTTMPRPIWYRVIVSVMND